MTTILTTIALLGSLGACCYYVLCLYAAQRFARQMRQFKRTGFTPPVSVLKPLCGTDPHAYESLRSHCTQDYPEYEIIFGVSDPGDAVIDIVRRLMQEFPDRKIHLVACRDMLGSNFKVSNLIQMFPHAQYEYILVNDSDICVASDYVLRVMDEFQSDRVGLVTCLYRGIAGKTLGSKLEAVGISTDFVPGVLSARELEQGLRFGLGSTLAFRRKALAAVGGFQAVADYLGDDYELGKRIAESGYRVVLAACIVDHYLPDYSFADYFRHQLRWARTVRNSRPGGYAGLIFTFGVLWAALGLIFAQRPWDTGLFVGTIVLRFTVALRTAAILKDRLAASRLWLVPIRDVAGAAIWAASYGGRRVVWRGNQFTLEKGKLRP